MDKRIGLVEVRPGHWHPASFNNDFKYWREKDGWCDGSFDDKNWLHIHELRIDYAPLTFWQRIGRWWQKLDVRFKLNLAFMAYIGIVMASVFSRGWRAVLERVAYAVVGFSIGFWFHFYKEHRSK